MVCFNGLCRAEERYRSRVAPAGAGDFGVVRLVFADLERSTRRGLLGGLEAVRSFERALQGFAGVGIGGGLDRIGRTAVAERGARGDSRGVGAV